MGPNIAHLFVSTLVLLTQLLTLAEGQNIGACYGLNGDNLPSPVDVINLYKTNGIKTIRIYQPYPQVLEALRGSGLLVTMGPLNSDIEKLATSQDAANAWVNANMVAYNDVSFQYITIGNEVIPGPLGSNVPAAMNNIKNALASAGITGVKVTTVVAMTALGVSYPPSAGAFINDVTETMTAVSGVLTQQDAPLMINVYPYFAYASDPTHIPLSYALFDGPTVVDGNLSYTNLFDAMVDSFNAALEKINCGSIKLYVAESGWPTLGNPPFTSVSNAENYNKGLRSRLMKSGTPRRPDYLVSVFFFAMFNEDLKDGPVEQNFGFFYPNMQPVYPFWGSQ